MSQEVTNYIKQSLAEGKTKEQIWEELKRAGWQENDVKRAFQEAGLMETDRAMPPAPASASKAWTGKETISVVFLVLLPPVGLILMWTMANWSKKAKIIITAAMLLPFIAIAGILSSIVLVSLGGAREAARDAMRKSDMRQIVIAQELYFNMSDAFYTSVTYPSSIESFMPTTPADPKTNGPYGWVNNISNSQKFCAYADLEKGGFYIASNQGNGEIAVEPSILSDCENFSGSWSY